MHDGRIYSLSIYCGEQYPNKPPSIKFKSKINMTCVNQSNGTIDPAKFSVLGNWKNSYSIETVLSELKREMQQPHNKKLSQPPEGTMF